MIRYEYDGEVDALYIVLADGEPSATSHFGDVAVDLDESGQPVGVEVISAS